MKISQPKKLLTLLPVSLLLGVSFYFITRYGVDDIIILVSKNNQATDSCAVLDARKSHFVDQNIKGSFYDYRVTYRYTFDGADYTGSCFISERILKSPYKVKFLKSNPEISVLVGGSSVPLKYSAHYTVVVSLIILVILLRTKEKDIQRSDG